MEADSGEGKNGNGVWMAHEDCANVVPETWVDDLEVGGVKEKVVMGVNAIVNGRWNLVSPFCLLSHDISYAHPLLHTEMQRMYEDTT